MSRKPNIIVIIGTRPEVVKLAPVVGELKRSGKFQVTVLATGQHLEMAAQAFAGLDLAVDQNLALMEEGQSLPRLTAKVLQSVFAFLEGNQSDAVVVQGDTTTAFAAGLAAFYSSVPIAHVEAGLRTGDMGAPWPEEMNRRLLDPICRWCFAPTDHNRSNLLAEGVPSDRIHVTGNTVVDSLLKTLDRVRDLGAGAPSRLWRRTGLSESFRDRYLGRANAKWLLVTVHRRESIGQGVRGVCEGIRRIVERFPGIGVVLPVHPNPNVEGTITHLLRPVWGVELVSPLGYEEFVWLLSSCHFILSDSGGIQEEAPSLGKPVLVLRDSTERPEGIAAGTSRLVGTNPDRIFREACVLLQDSKEYSKRSRAVNPFGDGLAASRIAQILERDLCR